MFIPYLFRYSIKTDNSIIFKEPKFEKKNQLKAKKNALGVLTKLTYEDL